MNPPATGSAPHASGHTTVTTFCGGAIVVLVVVVVVVDVEVVVVVVDIAVVEVVDSTGEAVAFCRPVVDVGPVAASTTGSLRSAQAMPPSAPSPPRAAR